MLQRKFIIIGLLLLCWTNISLYSNEIMLSFEESLELLEGKLKSLQRLITSSDEKILGLETQLIAALQSARESAKKSEKLISTQNEQLQNVSKSLKDLEKATEENQKKHLLKIEEIRQAHEREIGRYQMLAFGLAGGILGGLAGYVIADTKGAIIGIGSGAGVGILVSLIF